MVLPLLPGWIVILKQLPGRSSPTAPTGQPGYTLAGAHGHANGAARRHRTSAPPSASCLRAGGQPPSHPTPTPPHTSALVPPPASSTMKVLPASRGVAPECWAHSAAASGSCMTGGQQKQPGSSRV